MNIFQHEKPGTVVRASAAKLQIVLTFLQNNLGEPEKFIRLAGPEIFAAFHNFSNGHIQEAIDEAVREKTDDVVIAAYAGTKEQHEAKVSCEAATEAAAKEAAKAAQAPAPAAPAETATDSAVVKPAAATTTSPFVVPTTITN